MLNIFLPKNFKVQTFEQQIPLSYSDEKVFQMMIRKRTFTQGGIPGFSWVEFTGAGPEMTEGEDCVHHGFLLNLPGKLTKIIKPLYREMQYYYGAYIFGMYLVRPLKLEVFVERMSDNKSVLRLCLTSQVRVGFNWFWLLFQSAFFLQMKWNIRILAPLLFRSRK